MPSLIFLQEMSIKRKHLLLSSLIQTLLSASELNRISFRSRAVPPVEITLLEEIHSNFIFVLIIANMI